MGVDTPRIIVQNFIPGEAAELWHVFMSSVHELAGCFYTEAQINAWAPPIAHDECLWADRIAALRSFVITVADRVAGYADLQESGYIDHFFVAAECSRKGVGSALMQCIHDTANQRQMAGLSADASLAAEAFFLRHGFAVMQRRSVVINGVSMPNAHMVKRLAKEPKAHGMDGDCAVPEAFV